MCGTSRGSARTTASSNAHTPPQQRCRSRICHGGAGAAAPGTCRGTYRTLFVGLTHPCVSSAGADVRINLIQSASIVLNAIQPLVGTTRADLWIFFCGPRGQRGLDLTVNLWGQKAVICPAGWDSSPDLAVDLDGQEAIVCPAGRGSSPGAGWVSSSDPDLRRDFTGPSAVILGIAWVRAAEREFCG